MRRSYITSAFAGALLLGLGTTAALAVTGEFNNMCTEGLAPAKTYRRTARSTRTLKARPTASAASRPRLTLWKDPKGNLAKAQAYYKSKHPG